MRRVLLAAFYAWSAFGQNPRTTREDAAAGGKIFRSHCADCHGLNGQGGKGPDLTTGVFFHGSRDEDLFRNITDGIPGTAMPDAFYSADQVWQVVAHIRSLERKGSAAPPPGDAARGAALASSKGCLGCHLVRGKGGIQGPDLTHIGSQRTATHLREAILAPGAVVDRAYWRANIELENGTPYQGYVLNEDTYTVQLLDGQGALRSLEKRNFRKYAVDKQSAMPSYQGKLTNTELNDLVAYLWSLQRPRRAE